MFKFTNNFVILIISFCFCGIYANSQTIVRNSQELENYLKQDKEIGTLLLDGDVFQIGSFETLAGGCVKPYGNRKPTLLRPYQTVKRTGNIIIKGYWTAKVKGYGAQDYIFLDCNRNPINYSSHVDGKDNLMIYAKDLIRYNRESRLFKLKIPEGYESLKEKSCSQFKNCMIEAMYWYRDIKLTNLHSDGVYLYGTIDNQFNYDLLDVRPHSTIMMRFIDFPFQDGGIYLDGDDVLHIPEKYNEVHMCYSDVVLNLKGQRDFRVENITIDGSYQGVRIDGINKHIVNCIIRNCGDGVAGKSNRGFCSVINCNFRNLIYNSAITLSGQNVHVEGNKISNTGLVNKGGAAIAVNGKNFLIKDNDISSFTYNAIAVGCSKDSGVVDVSGRIVGNIIDNSELYGVKWSQLDDGGGIYVWVHTDGVVIEDNVIRNLGYEGCDMWGIYLDDGAYNCSVRRNLVYNMWPGEYALTSRYVESCERSNINNVFEDNILIGPCKIAGNKKGLGHKTIIRRNYICGELETQGNEYIEQFGNKFVKARVKADGKIQIDRKSGVKKRNYTDDISKLISLINM